MMLKIAFALSAALPLAASASSYGKTASTKFNAGGPGADDECKNALLARVTCTTEAVGKLACDNNGDCTAFVRNTEDTGGSDEACYLFNMPPGLITQCSIDGAGFQT